MFESGLTRMSCSRCGLDIRLHTSELQLDRCPRCYLHEAVLAPLRRRVMATHQPQLSPGTPAFGHLIITTERQSQAVVLALYGKLDLAAESCLEQALRRARAFGCTRVVIDLSALEFIDWSGLQLLLRARRETLEQGLRISLLRGPRSVQRLFERSGAADLFSFED
jgi:anti-anti-sigma factor